MTDKTKKPSEREGVDSIKPVSDTQAQIKAIEGQLREVRTEITKRIRSLELAKEKQFRNFLMNRIKDLQDHEARLLESLIRLNTGDPNTPSVVIRDATNVIVQIGTTGSSATIGATTGSTGNREAGGSTGSGSAGEGGGGEGKPNGDGSDKEPSKPEGADSGIEAKIKEFNDIFENNPILKRLKNEILAGSKVWLKLVIHKKDIIADLQTAKALVDEIAKNQDRKQEYSIVSSSITEILKNLEIGYTSYLSGIEKDKTEDLKTAIGSAVEESSDISHITDFLIPCYETAVPKLENADKDIYKNKVLTKITEIIEKTGDQNQLQDLNGKISIPEIKGIVDARINALNPQKPPAPKPAENPDGIKAEIDADINKSSSISHITDFLIPCYKKAESELNDQDKGIYKNKVLTKITEIIEKTGDQNQLQDLNGKISIPEIKGIVDARINALNQQKPPAPKPAENPDDIKTAIDADINKSSSISHITDFLIPCYETAVPKLENADKGIYKNKVLTKITEIIEKTGDQNQLQDLNGKISIPEIKGIVDARINDLNSQKPPQPPQPPEPPAPKPTPRSFFQRVKEGIGSFAGVFKTFFSRTGLIRQRKVNELADERIILEIITKEKIESADIQTKTDNLTGTNQIIFETFTTFKSLEKKDVANLIEILKRFSSLDSTDNLYDIYYEFLQAIDSIEIKDDNDRDMLHLNKKFKGELRKQFKLYTDRITKHHIKTIPQDILEKVKRIGYLTRIKQMNENPYFAHKVTSFSFDKELNKALDDLDTELTEKLSINEISESKECKDILEKTISKIDIILGIRNPLRSTNSIFAIDNILDKKLTEVLSKFFEVFNDFIPTKKGGGYEKLPDEIKRKLVPNLDLIYSLLYQNEDVLEYDQIAILEEILSNFTNNENDSSKQWFIKHYIIKSLKKLIDDKILEYSYFNDEIINAIMLKMDQNPGKGMDTIQQFCSSIYGLSYGDIQSTPYFYNKIESVIIGGNQPDIKSFLEPLISAIKSRDEFTKDYIESLSSDSRDLQNIFEIMDLIYVTDCFKFEDIKPSLLDSYKTILEKQPSTNFENTVDLIVKKSGDDKIHSYIQKLPDDFINIYYSILLDKITKFNKDDWKTYISKVDDEKLKNLNHFFYDIKDYFKNEKTQYRTDKLNLLEQIANLTENRFRDITSKKDEESRRKENRITNRIRRFARGIQDKIQNGIQTTFESFRAVFDRSKKIPEEQKNNRDTIISEIKSSLGSQPKNVQDFVNKFQNSLDTIFQDKAVEIGEFVFLCPKVCDMDGLQIVLQADKDNKNGAPRKWSLRYFRKSHSDLQPKALFGYIQGHYKKGNHWEDHHHYATSGKVNPELMKQLTVSEPDTNNYDFKEFCLPDTSESRFKETTVAIKNTELSEAISLYRDIYYIISEYNSNNNLKSLNFQKIKDERLKTFIKPFYDKDSLSPDDLSEIMNVLKLILRRVRLPFPNFDTNPTATYTSGDVKIEEYELNTNEGDKLVFCMGRTESGVVFVDRVYSKPRGITAYGTESSIVNMGFLTYKPHDYTHQVSLLETKVLDRTYSSLQPTFDQIPLIQRYRKKLENDGLTEPVKTQNLEILKAVAEISDDIKDTRTIYDSMDDFQRKIYILFNSFPYLEIDNIKFIITELKKLKDGQFNSQAELNKILEIHGNIVANISSESEKIKQSICKELNTFLSNTIEQFIIDINVGEITDPLRLSETYEFLKQILNLDFINQNLKYIISEKVNQIDTASSDVLKNNLNIILEKIEENSPKLTSEILSYLETLELLKDSTLYQRKTERYVLILKEKLEKLQLDKDKLRLGNDVDEKSQKYERLKQLLNSQNITQIDSILDDLISEESSTT